MHTKDFGSTLNTVSIDKSDVLPPQIKAEIEQFKSQGVEMEEKRKAILRGLEVSVRSMQNVNV